MPHHKHSSSYLSLNNIIKSEPSESSTNFKPSLSDSCLLEIVSPMSVTSTSSVSSRNKAKFPDKQQKVVAVHENEKKNVEDPIQKLLRYMRQKDWDSIMRLLERDPTLSRRNVTMVYEGEHSICLPLHLFCSRRSVPLSIIDMLVTLNPSALLEPDERGARLPLHIATSTGISQDIVNYLCRALPQSLHYADRDGNYPLHYAAMYASSATLQLFCQTYPQASRSLNERKRLPLHLLCSRFFDNDDFVSPHDFKLLIEAYPEALNVSDRCGRLPLHLAAEHPSITWGVMKNLIECYPAALVCKDNTKKTPLMLAKNRFVKTDHESHQSLISNLAKCTLQEIRKEKPYVPSFMVHTSFPYSKTSRRK